MKIGLVYWVFAALLCVSPACWAYLDPGSGSMLLQVILGGLAAVGVVFKMYWYRIKRALGLGNKAPVDE